MPRNWWGALVHYVGGLVEPEDIKRFFVYCLAFFFGIDEGRLKSLWADCEALVIDARKAFPGKGEGDNKYAFVIEKLQELGHKLAPMVVDAVIHLVLLYLSKLLKKKT